METVEAAGAQIALQSATEILRVEPAESASTRKRGDVMRANREAAGLRGTHETNALWRNWGLYLSERQGGLLRLKVTNSPLLRTPTLSRTLHGQILGIDIFFWRRI